MLGIVKNNKIIPLTTDTGTGAPIGTLIQQYKKKPMSGYLYCDGSTFDQNVYPALYMYLGTNVLPDYRECVMVGAEENTTDTIATHDVYTEGEFKDDQLQDHIHNISLQEVTDADSPDIKGITSYKDNVQNTSSSGVVNGRSGTTTHGKQKAVYVYIKATSGLAENQQDNVLNDVKDYVSPKLVYSTDSIEVYRQAGTYTFQFKGCSLTDYQTTIKAVLNNHTLPHSWVAFISRRDSGNNNIYPGTIVVSTDLGVAGWYSSSSGVETQMSMSDTLYGIATIIVTD